jgi:hypothetical protein
LITAPLATLPGIVGKTISRAVQLHLDRIEHLHGMAFVTADQANELAVAVEERPDAGALADRRLAAAPRHGHGEQATSQHRLFDLGQHLQMVR